MPTLTELPPATVFSLFLLALGLLPLALAWRESRTRSAARTRLAALRREAGITAQLRAAPR